MGTLIKTAIERPVAILALVLLTVLFGTVALRNIPIQMSPDIEKPILEVRVNWPGASPEDVDREIVARLERELASLNGLEEMASRSSRGRARVTLTYNVSQDMDKALCCSSASCPRSATCQMMRKHLRCAPQTRTTARLPAWLFVSTIGETNDLEGLGNFVETGIIEPLGRVDGVAEVTVYGGGNREMRILYRPA